MIHTTLVLVPTGATHPYESALILARQDAAVHETHGADVNGQ